MWFHLWIWLALAPSSAKRPTCQVSTPASPAAATIVAATAARSQELANQAEGLQEMVTRFQIDPAPRVTTMPVALVPRRHATAARA